MASIDGKRDHLGVGWAFPVRPVAGALRFIAYEADVEQSIGLILETARRERVMEPDFGGGLRDWVFASNSPQVQRAVEGVVERALREHEPRIDVEGVRARTSPDARNVMLIEIDYVVRRTNSAFNLVYPFYLSEGV
ncbi:MAG: GPW/gp25 family protein [Deltaproteobacteria bacterium]|nr:GPW/gp25 family protein [Deltaproteobacteria bacterium]